MTRIDYTLTWVNEIDSAAVYLNTSTHFTEDNLSTVQRELGLEGISSNPQSLVVIGRSRSLTDENKRKLVTLENESPRIKVMTYDDVLIKAKEVIENLLGPLWDDVTGNTKIYYIPKQ